MDRGNFNVSSKLQVVLFVPLFLFIVTGNYLISGPIFEGYLFSEQLTNENFSDWAPNFLGRPLSLVPNILIYFFFDSSRFGYFFVSSTLLILRGSTVFFIRERLGLYTLPVSLLVMVLPLWPAALNERFIAAQFSINFSLLALCLYIRNPSKRKLVILLSFLSILTYPPVALVLPLTVIIVSIQHPSSRKLFLYDYMRLLWVFLPLVFYFLWLAFLKLLGFNSYDTRSGGLPTLAAADNLIDTLFSDSFGISLLLMLFPFLLLRMFYPRVPILLSFFSISLIYFSPLPYSQLALHLNDPERVFFCISLTSLFTSVLLICTNKEKSFSQRRFQMVLSSHLIVGLISLTFIVHQWMSIQGSNRDFLKQIEEQLGKHPFTKSILVEDYSGYVGDVRTYYGSSTLENILTEGNSLLAAIRLKRPDFFSAIVCTPKGVTRIHPTAANFPIPTTRECDPSADKPDLILKLTSFEPVVLTVVSD